MASQRELIAQNIVSVLKNQTEFKFGRVTREPMTELTNMAKTAFPCVVIEGVSEQRQDITQGGAGILRQSEAEYSIYVYAMAGGKNQDTERNAVIEAVETLLDRDRTRGAHAIDTELINIDVQELAQQPYVTIRLVIRVTYHYLRGQS